MKTKVKCTMVGREYVGSCSPLAILFHLQNKMLAGYAPYSDMKGTQKNERHSDETVTTRTKLCV